MLHRAKCWEYQNCGREKSGANVSELGICPSYPDNGRRCWGTAGTLCGGEIQGTNAQKIDSCESCNWYKNVNSGIA